MSRHIDVSSLSKAEVLCRLYNAAQSLGMGRLHYRPKPMTTDEAQAILDAPRPTDDTGSFPRERLRFDYLYGRVMKIDLRENPLFVGLYDRDNGQGAASRALGLPMVEDEGGAQR